MFEEIPRIIREKSHFVICAHYNPDGDAVGSVLGLAEILENMGKKALRFFADPIPALYRFLPGSDQACDDLGQALAFFTEGGSEAALIALDCGDESRLGKAGPELLRRCRPVLVLDHHQSNPGFGDYNWIDPESVATTALVYELAQKLEARVSPRAASCLYAGLSTDSGSFQYPKTTKRMLLIAAALVEAGADAAVLADQLYNTCTPGRLQLLCEVLATLEMHAHDRIAVIRVTQDMLDRTGTTKEDIEHFVAFPRAIQSVKAAVFLKETAPDRIAVSLRAKGQCDVAEVAAHFGGGGHNNASGCVFRHLSMDAVRDALLPHLERNMAG